MRSKRTPPFLFSPMEKKSADSGTAGPLQRIHRNVVSNSLQRCIQPIATLYPTRYNVVCSWLQCCTQLVAMLHFPGLRHEKSGQNHLVRAAFAQPLIFSPSRLCVYVGEVPTFQLLLFSQRHRGHREEIPFGRYSCKSRSWKLVADFSLRASASPREQGFSFYNFTIWV